MIARSWLFVPGNRPERFDKACAAGADAVIVDLEDAVPPDEKDAARAALAGWLRPERPVVVRINGADSAWFEGDLALCAQSGLAGIMLPKAERCAELERLGALAPTTPLLPLIETAAGFANAEALARGPGVRRLIFGSIDFQLDLGIAGDGEEPDHERPGAPAPCPCVVFKSRKTLQIPSPFKPRPRPSPAGCAPCRAGAARGLPRVGGARARRPGR